MAILKAGITGKLNGKISNSKAKNNQLHNHINRKVADLSDPHYLNEEIQRENLLYAIEIYKILRPILQKSLRLQDKKQSFFSEFLRLNLNSSIVNCSVDLDKLVIAKSDSSGINISNDYKTLMRKIPSRKPK